MFCRNIENVTRHANECELKLSEILEENEELRARLGLDPREPLDFKFKQSRLIQKESDRAVNIILQKEVQKIIAKLKKFSIRGSEINENLTNLTNFKLKILMIEIKLCKPS